MKKLKQILLTIATLMSPLAIVAQNQYVLAESVANTNSGQQGDVEVRIANGELTTFNKFLKEHWNDINIPDPDVAQYQTMQSKIRSAAKAQYGVQITPSRKLIRPANGKSVGGASKNRGGGYSRRSSSSYDPEKDARLLALAIAYAEAQHATTRQLHNQVMGDIAADANFKPSVNGQDMARKHRENFENQVTNAKGTQVKPTEGMITDFNEPPTYDYEELLQRFIADENSLTLDELTFLDECMTQEIEYLQSKKIAENEESSETY